MITIKYYEVTTNFDDSMTLLESWQEAVYYVRNKARELNKRKTDFNIKPFKP
jgi:TfoX/Sxy family transcriptional regulator of competence genes